MWLTALIFHASNADQEQRGSHEAYRRGSFPKAWGPDSQRRDACQAGYAWQTLGLASAAPPVVCRSSVREPLETGRNGSGLIQLRRIYDTESQVAVHREV